MLYLLLSIIAVGVLLASEHGQKLLKIILIFIGIGFGLYVLYWLVFLGFIFGSEFFEKYPDLIGVLIFLGVMGCIFYSIDKFNKKKGKKKNYKLGNFNKNFIKITFISFGIFTLLLLLMWAYLQI